MKKTLQLNSRQYISIAMLGIASLYQSCSNYLDIKQEMKVVTPKSLEHLRSMLDNSSHVNFGVYSGLLEFGTDDYVVSETALNNVSEFERSAYMFSPLTDFSQYELYEFWSAGYRPVFVANTVIDYLDKVNVDDREEKNEILGAALFLRGFAFYQVAQVFAAPFNTADAGINKGIPLRLSSDFDIISTRSSVHETYEQIERDLMTATRLLPLQEEFSIRPTKLAAWAMLARVKLLKSDYVSAMLYADSVLQYNSHVLNFHDVDGTADIPFEIMNEETIFTASSSGGYILNPVNAEISQDLLQHYQDCDLRKQIFLKKKTEDAYTFKGNYLGAVNSGFFVGLTVPEVILIKAECALRLNQKVEGLDALKLLTRNRYMEGCEPYNYTEEELTLRHVLDERRKELTFRGIRWSDLRRLNMDAQFAKTVTHEVKGSDRKYMLEPNDNGYVYPIPQEIVNRTGMQQNDR